MGCSRRIETSEASATTCAAVAINTLSWWLIANPVPRAPVLVRTCTTEAAIAAGPPAAAGAPPAALLSPPQPAAEPASTPASISEAYRFHPRVVMEHSHTTASGAAESRAIRPPRQTTRPARHRGLASRYIRFVRLEPVATPEELYRAP